MSGKMHGMGKYKYNNGLIYEGRYSNGAKDGHGKLIYPDGKIFEGDFINGIPQGQDYLISNKNYILRPSKVVVQ